LRVPPFLLVILVLSACGTAVSQDTDRPIPFTRLEAPDTLRTVQDVAALKWSNPTVDVDDRSITEPNDPLEEGSAMLVKRAGDRWLAYALPLYKDSRSVFELQHFTSDGRFLIAEQWSNNFTRGQEVHETELYLIDLERLTYASVTILEDNFEWTIDEHDVQHDHRTRDSSVVSITSTHIHLVHGCKVNGKPVPCKVPSASYRLTPEALVPDSSISIAPVVTGASQLPAPPGGWDRHTLRRNQRVCPGRTAKNMARPLVDAAARGRLLQYAISDFTGATLRYGAKLPFENGLRITLLCERDDDHDLLWLTYDQLGQLQGVDTLASTYGDGQYAVSECIHLSPYGQLLVESVHNETLRDEVDTMAYRCDTLVYEPVIEGVAYADESGEVKHRYQLRRRVMDLSRCWVEKHHVDAQPPYLWHSLREVIPPGRRVFLQASGDLNRDGAEDHVIVLTNEADDGPRDLLIAFTAPDGGRFVQHALHQSFLPEKESGGFHDPIGEEGISGISIAADTLVITQFGGSAWKWTSTDKYVFDPVRKAFYLVESGGRSFHASGEESQAEELQALEELRTKQRLTKEQAARYGELKELADKATWKSTRYPLGTRPMGK
jgi:hypothetical protein